MLKKESWAENSMLTVFARASSIVSVPLILAIGSIIWWVMNDLIESHVTKPLMVITERVNILENRIDINKTSIDENKNKNILQDLQIAKDNDNLGTIGLDVKAVGVKLDSVVSALSRISSDVAVLNERTKELNNKGVIP